MPDFVTHRRKKVMLSLELSVWSDYPSQNPKPDIVTPQLLKLFQLTSHQVRSGFYDGRGRGSLCFIAKKIQ
jgi:hypothetical protein